VRLHDEFLRQGSKIVYTFTSFPDLSFAMFLEKLQGDELGSRLSELRRAEISPPSTDKLTFIKSLLASHKLPESCLEETAKTVYLSLPDNFNMSQMIGEVDRAKRQKSPQASLYESQINSIFEGIQDGTARAILEAIRDDKALTKNGYTLKEIFGYLETPGLTALRCFCADALARTTLTFDEIGARMGGRTAVEVKKLRSKLEEVIDAESLEEARRDLMEKVPSLKF